LGLAPAGKLEVRTLLIVLRACFRELFVGTCTPDSLLSVRVKGRLHSLVRQARWAPGFSKLTVSWPVRAARGR
jgi:hypothetical protein